MKKAALINIALALGGAFVLPGANAVEPEAVPVARFYPYVDGYPSQRPANAPKAKFERDNNWYATALMGISKPYPYSLRFLDSQGAWYTPFNRPGMVSYYDVRNWHPRLPSAK